MGRSRCEAISEPLKITINVAPASALMAAQREAYPANVRITKTAFTASEKAMFSRTTARVRRE